MTSYELCVEPQVSEIPRLIDWVEACCGAEGLANHVSFRVALALEEAVTNVIGHAFAGMPPPHQITVRLDGRLLVHDALALRAADGNLRDRLGRFNVLAIAVLAGTTLAAAASSLVAKASASPVHRRLHPERAEGPDQLVAATSLGDRGCVVRFAGTSVERVGRTIREFLGFVPALLEDDPWIRKW